MSGANHLEMFMSALRVANYWDDPSTGKSRFASPIEEMLAVALVVEARSHGIRSRFWCEGARQFHRSGTPDAWNVCNSGLDSVAWLVGSMECGLLMSQMAAGPYRVDLALIMQTSAGTWRIAIECDGHDFHEKTKEQARHDKARDRFLVSDGWTVLRFAGSEIWADPLNCARQTWEIVASRGIRQRASDLGAAV